MDRLSRRKVLLLVVLALALRLGLIVAAGPFTEPDSLTYDNLARNLAGGQGYSDTRPFKILDGSMSVPPVYPGFLAAVYAVFGFRYGPVIVIQQVLGALLAALACLIATRLFGGRIGFWTGLIVALHPWLIVYGSTLMTEALFTFLFAASMYFLVKGLFSGRVLDFALAGLVMGLAILCRASFQYYVLLIPVVLLVALKDFKRAAWHSLAYLVPVLFLLGGWCLRNQRTHGFFGLTSVGGINFIAGLNPPPSSYDLRDPFEKALLEACNSPATRTIASVIPPSGQGRMVFKSGTVYCTNEAAKTLLDQGYSLAEVDREFTRIALKQVRKAPVRLSRSSNLTARLARPCHRTCRGSGASS